MIFNFYILSGRLHHTTACLIEGLHELGHQINVNQLPNLVGSNGICPPFSKYAPDYIQQTSQPNPGLIIVDNSLDWSDELSNFLGKLSETNHVVIINMNNFANYLPHPENFYVFQGHYNKMMPRKGKTFPMAYGLSKEIIELSDNLNLNLVREPSIIHNFRPNDNQMVRHALMLSLLPKLEKYYSINTLMTEPPEFAQQLLTHQAVFCYSGHFYSDVRLHRNFFNEENNDDRYYDFQTCAKKNSESVIFRFDSFRLYEAALFGAAPITLHFEKYGLETGANPRPWIEYIPVEFDKIESLPLEIASRVKEDPDFLIKVGQNARRWVIENHSPVAAAQRFIRKLEELKIY